MTVTMKDIPTIINDLKKRKPSALAKDSDRPLSRKEAVMQLAPTLLKKKEEGFTTAELVCFLAKHQITVKPHNMARYLREFNSSNVKPQSESEQQTPKLAAPILKQTGQNNSLHPDAPHQ
ncbi:hypothetical protein LJB86_03590 [Deltaproteobacteria bacterium OttesenSCG-928-M10]|nr:hypothetical protein [Deltaproteobacteria bacterium OttesenSCG-928-M10]